MQTVKELIDFFEAIPSERWTKHKLSSWENGYMGEPEQNCAFGHLNKHLHGNFNYDINSKNFSWLVVSRIGVSPSELVFVNNEGPHDAKTNVLNFLKQKEAA